LFLSHTFTRRRSESAEPPEVYHGHAELQLAI